MQVVEVAIPDVTREGSRTTRPTRGGTTTGGEGCVVFLGEMGVKVFPGGVLFLCVLRSAPGTTPKPLLFWSRRVRSRECPLLYDSSTLGLREVRVR